MEVLKVTQILLARYNSDVGQSDCMSAQQNGNDVARGEQNPQQRFTND